MVRIRLGTELSLASPERTVHLLLPLRPDPPTVTDAGEPIWSGWPGLVRWFELSPLEECDVAVLPFPWEDALADENKHERAVAFCKRAEALGRSVFVFYHNDPEVRIPIPNAVTFAHALHASRRKASDFAMPNFVPWPRGEVGLRPYRERPSVGFCGKAWPLGADYRSLSHKLSVGLRSFAGTLLVRSGLNDRLGSPVTFYHRVEALRTLEHDARVETRFLVRDARPLAYTDAYRREYLDNITETDYTLVVRGKGNFSIRLYEALSFGRIPLFVNTDCVLPLASEIDWRSLCIWVEGGELRTIGDRFIRAHRAMTPDEFRERQRRCHDIWRTKLTEPGFFSSLYERLAGAVSAGDFIGTDGRRRLLRCLA